MEFEEIYKVHSAMVFNLALSYAQNTEDAEEITQDVFVAVYSSMQLVKDPSHLKTWIYRIAINKSLDFIKSKKRKKRFTQFMSFFDLDHNEVQQNNLEFNHPGILLVQKESLKRVFDLINELPDKQKTALILCKIEHKSQIEAAEIMQISPKAVESLFQRAKTNLAKKLNQNEG